MALRIATLPAFVALLTLSPTNYLKYVVDDEDVDTHGLLMTNRDSKDPLSVLCRLEVMPARANGRVHIRCTYNNKFMVLLSELGDDAMAPVADEPVENASTWRCTMCVPSHAALNDSKQITLLHVQRGLNVLIPDSNNRVPTLSAPPPLSPSSNMIFYSMDLGPLFRMPRYVALKGHNGEYLQFFVNNPARRYLCPDACSSCNRRQMGHITGARGRKRHWCLLRVCLFLLISSFTYKHSVW